MKHLRIAAIFMILAPSLYAIGNVVVDDLDELKKQGFRFSVERHGSDDSVVNIQFETPKTFHFGEVMGVKPFQDVSFYEPVDKSARDARLIGAPGTRLSLVVQKRGEKFHGELSLIEASAKAKYLEFHFNQRSGYPPMLIHVSLQLLVSQLQE